MKTKNAPQIAYAILNAISLSTDGGSDWCQIMPAGRVKARDGRPKKPAEGWLINRATVERMVSGVVALNQPVKIDYN
ncbi:phage protease, partial [Escherichia coli]